MAKSIEEINDDLVRFNKAYKESGLTDGKISKLAAMEANKKAGIYKKTEEQKKALSRQLNNPEVRSKVNRNRLEKYGNAIGALGTAEAKAKSIATRLERYGNAAGYINTVEAKAKYRAEMIEKFGNVTGHMRTPEAKAKYQEAMIKRRRPILQYDLEGNFVGEWDCVDSARATIGGGIRNCINGRQKTAGGFIWKYKNEQ